MASGRAADSPGSGLAGQPVPPALAEQIIDYRPFIARTTQGFVGRDWLRAQVDGFLQAADRRTFLLSGEPGLGKTSFLAHLVAERGYVHHFVSARDLNWLSPEAFASSVGAQLARRFGAWVLAEEEPPPGIQVDQEIGAAQAGATVVGVIIAQYVGLPAEELARRLILRPLNRLAARGQPPVVLIVDAVDEANRYSGPTTIADLLAGLGASPARLILTAQPGEVLDQLSFELAATGLLPVEMRGEQPDNLDDLRAYLEQAAGEPAMAGALLAAGVTPGAFVDQALARSEGNFLYATSLLEAIRAGQAGLDPAALPTGLAGYYRDQVRRLKKTAGAEWRPTYRPVLGVLAVARAPLTAAQLAALAGVERDAASEVVANARPLLDDRPATGGLPAYACYHLAFAAFLTSERDNPDDYFEPARYHARIADQLLARSPDPARMEDEYGLLHLAHHLRQAGPDHFPQLFELIRPAVRRQRRARFGSDAPFRQDVGEAIEAALALGPAEGLPQLVRCGLIDATLASAVVEIPIELLGELARQGQPARALSLTPRDSGRRGPALRAIVQGLLLWGSAEGLEVARQVASQIAPQADEAADRAVALAAIAARLAAGGRADEARTLFDEAAGCACQVPVPDAQARALAEVARLRYPSEPGAARAGFEAAIAALDEMQVDLDAVTREEVSAASMVTQTAPESRWMMDHIPFDTVGARARAMADVAAAMARAGAPGAEALFDRAEEVAATIPAAGLHGLFGQHARDYIAAQRALPPEAAARLEPAALEARLEAAWRPPADERGFYAQALLALARALWRGGEREPALSLLKKAEAAGQAAAGGYRARLLAEMAELLSEMGEAELAGEWAEEAREIAGQDADLLTGYRALLARVGTAWAADLRRVALSPAFIQKQRTYSDRALAEMAAALAERDPAAAHELSRSIHDASQRMRAVAAVAGRLARLAPAALESTGLVPGLPTGEAAAVQLVRGELPAPGEDRQALLATAVEALAPLAPGAALELTADLEGPASRAKALAEVAAGSAALGLPAKPAWEAARAAAQAAPEATASLALAAAAIACHWYGAGDARANQALARALDALRGEPSRLERIDASVLVAATLAPFRPEQAQALLDEAGRLAGDLGAGRAQGQALSRVAAAQMALDAGRGCRLLAGLRRTGRDSFLDGVARIVPEAARLGGARLVARLAASLEEAQAFFSG